MKDKVILHLTSLTSGGGGNVTIDIHHSILNFGYQSYVVIRGKKCLFPDGSVHDVPQTRHYWWNKLRRYVFRKIAEHSDIDNTYAMYNLCERFTCYSAKDILSALPRNPDVIFIHWVSDFINARIIRDLKSITGAKIVLLMIDHAMFSGGCHYQIDCQGFKNGCHNCPATTSRLVRYGIAQNFAFKKKYLPRDIFVSAYSFERQHLMQSVLFRTCKVGLIVFPNNESQFRPSKNRAALREKWGIPENKRVIFAGATSLREKRKGMFLLFEALQYIKNKDYLLFLAGNQMFPLERECVLQLGYLDNNRLIEAYQVSDVFVCPSIADAGPLMVKQACLCGTPVVAFPVGYSCDLIKTDITGYLANYRDIEDLARGIDSILSLTKIEWKSMSDRCSSEAHLYFSPYSGGIPFCEWIQRI